MTSALFLNKAILGSLDWRQVGLSLEAGRTPSLQAYKSAGGPRSGLSYLSIYLSYGLL